MNAQDRPVRREARQILAEMPGVVSLGDVAMELGISRGHASTCLHRWIQAGHLERFSSGLCFNLVQDRDARAHHLGDALKRLLMRPFIMVGGGALYHGGWTNQVHEGIEIAAPFSRDNMRVPQTSCGVRIVPRREADFLELYQHQNPDASGWQDVPVLDPAWAIADASLSGRWFFSREHPTRDIPPDEIDTDYIGEDGHERLSRALEGLKASSPDRERCLETYGPVLTRERNFHPGY